jgi:PIN domain nuclease of toxin-antitoxin system
MSIVLDASAVVAMLFREPGADVVAEAVADSRLSTVNAAEVLTRLVRAGADAGEAYDVVRRLPLTIVPFTETQALAVAALHELTAPRGLSLGDRACLALASELDAAVMTADRVWNELPLDVEITCIR